MELIITNIKKEKPSLPDEDHLQEKGTAQAHVPEVSKNKGLDTNPGTSIKTPQISQSQKSGDLVR